MAIEETQDSFLDFWEDDIFSPKEIYEWLEGHQQFIAQYIIGHLTKSENCAKLGAWKTLTI